MILSDETSICCHVALLSNEKYSTHQCKTDKDESFYHDFCNLSSHRCSCHFSVAEVIEVCGKIMNVCSGL